MHIVITYTERFEVEVEESTTIEQVVASVRDVREGRLLGRVAKVLPSKGRSAKWLKAGAL